MTASFVVTGGGQGVGRAIVERLAELGHVVALDLDADALAWTSSHARVIAVSGDAGDEAVASQAADAAERMGPLAGWVNNAAVFRDASLHSAPANEVLELISLNLGLAVTGCATAVRRFLAGGHPGAIVNVSSHQAQRAVPGALPYATAKAAIEGLTRALAVDYGPHGIRTNAVALGSITTPATRRYAPSSPASRRRCGACTRSAGSGGLRRWRPRSLICCQTTRATSTARSCRSTAGEPFLARTPRRGNNALMASYSVNDRAVKHARKLIDARQYVLESDWGESQPKADDENEFLASHTWEEYAEWHLGLTDGASEETKALYAFVYGDFRRLHRTGLIACVYRASEWRHKEIELAAHELLQHLDKTSA